MKYLIVGLGNIGTDYDNTRHNIGFDVVDYIAKEHDAKFEVDKLASYTTFRFKGKGFHLIKPTTYMNLSGKAVKYWMDKLKIPRENVLIVVDDLALPFGKTRLKGKGSDAGHNGLKNIQQVLGTPAYPRLKCGIGNDYPKGKQIDFVLGQWTKTEQEGIPEMLEKAYQTTIAFASIGITRAMNQFN